MSYFSKFPKVRYSFDNGATSKVAVDIVTRVKVRDYIKNNTEMFAEYQISDGDTPEMVADKIYGDSELHWIIMVFNEITNPYYDWALSQRKLEAYAFNKYRGETWFLTDWSSDDILPTNFNPVRNDTVMGVSGGGVDPATTYPYPYDSGSAGLVRKWDKTLSRLEVINITGDGFVEGDYISAIGTSADGSTYTMSAKIAKRVQRSIDALHHFEDPDTQTILNPLGTVPQPVSGEQAVVGHTAGISGGWVDFDFLQVAAGLTQTLLFGYMINDATNYVVTNYQYEDTFNETNRVIKLIKPEFIQKVVKDFEQLMRGA